MAISEHFKHAIDGVGLTTLIATLAGWLPVIAALASLVWTLIRIYETETVQEFVRSRWPNMALKRVPADA